MTRTTYPALPTGRIAPEGCFLSTSHSPTQVRIDSPALQVMTDLTRQPAASIARSAPTIGVRDPWHYLKHLTSVTFVSQHGLTKAAGGNASSRRKPGSSIRALFWTPAFAGVTGASKSQLDGLSMLKA